MIRGLILLATIFGRQPQHDPWDRFRPTKDSMIATISLHSADWNQAMEKTFQNKRSFPLDKT